MRWVLKALRRAVCILAALAAGGALTANSAFAQAGPAPGGARMPAEHVNVVHELSLSAAQKLLAKGLGIAAERNLKLAIAVVDRAGHQLAFARMDGAAIVTVEVAIGKARTAAFLKAPSKLFEDMINSGKPSMATVPGLLPLEGGMPVLLDGEVIGAVGVSGGTDENDQEIATLIAKLFAEF
ncbi:GlcG/HbpS family heme-binding protein [Xanthobacter versatilis]|uniref:GlcG/HbpS family heme-binding protein n=1 Tax=Xanthobacter autotrophicus (strain ATCC BAA-1158 / Py2) TaxID=78245 RepID=UPI00372CB645